MSTFDPWTDRLSEYLDGDLAHDERIAFEAHLDGCAECRAVLDDLRAVVATARRLPDLPPSRDLWPEVAERTRGVLPLRPRAARTPSSWVRLAMAAALFAAVGSGVTWLAMTRGPGAPAAPIATADAPASATPRTVSDRPRGTDAAIAELEQIVRQGESRLDTATVRIVTENLARIDTAIAQAQRALAGDPSNAYVRRHLADTERRKIELLRTTARIVQSQS
ncbi:MAG TPA: zf-HC2 domain-containing protein [Gemmatimonadales bacterium]|nr:zf-HC2 domain-containing protein [Gemmatimonadales bacterium]